MTDTDRIMDMLVRETDPAPPEGFHRIGDRGGYDLLIGPFFGKMEDGHMILAFRCAERHVNGRGVCHGGMMASLADQAAYAVRVSGGVVDHSLVTVSLTIEFLRPVDRGDWVEVRTRANKHGRTLHFAQFTGTVGDRAVLQASAVFMEAGDDPEGPVSLAAVLGTDA
ncbi:PaaI family thioesterase [Mesobacterium pallidum]|uniref:PaaI family thioesterase n=1 Tax=Mesobacterium pallidum TaxID=2872037 RepID=UPI001EE2B3ED|nr:PaaI family thioesterase [Mesobacterium pallidum]